ncbi:hypothetical protein MTO96_015303 [Rhipicephalus appendiculatus]
MGMFLRYIILLFELYWMGAMVHCKLGAPGGPQKLHHDVADALQTIISFPLAVAISDSDNDTYFDCVYTVRTELDVEAQTATYMWSFPSVGLEVPFHVRPGKAPGTLYFTVGDDPTDYDGAIYYTDYKTCVIADMEYRGHQCALWATREVKDSVPQQCIDQFVDTCGVVAPAHSRDLCPDGEGDY